MIVGFGKFILVLSLCLQGVLLIQGLDAKITFDANLQSIAKTVPQLSFIQNHIEYSDLARFVLAGLYFVSICILVSTCGCIPLMSGLGVIVNTAIQAAPALSKDQQDKNAIVLVLKNLSILAGLIFLAGANCNVSKSAKKVKSE